MEISEGQAPGGRTVAFVLNNLGTVALRRGNLDEADDYLRRALTIWQSVAPDSLDLAPTLNNLGALARERGDLEQARDYYQRTLKIKQQFVPDSLDVAGTLNSLGTLAFSRGELARAKDLLQRALAIRQRQASGSLIEAGTLSNLGSLALVGGELAAAEAFFQRALEIYQQLAPSSLNSASILSNLGTLALLRDDLDRSDDYHRRSLEIRQKEAPFSSSVAESLSVLGAIAQKRADLEQAESFYLRSLKTWQQVAPDSNRVAGLFFMLGLLNVQMKPPRLGEADRFLGQALDALERQLAQFGGSHDARADFRADHDNYYRFVLETQLSLDRPEAAFRTLERSRARSFLEHFAEREVVFTADIPEELEERRRGLAVRFDRAQQGLTRLDEHEHAARIETLRTQLRRMRDEARDVEEEIRSASPRLTALRYPQPLDIQASRSGLDPGTLLLSYSIGKNETSLFVASRGTALTVESLPVGKEALEAQVKDLLDRLGQARSDSSLGKKRLQQLQETSRHLYALLLEPVAERIVASDRLLILPDGSLHVLPFAALLRGGAEGEDGQYLVEWKPIHVALSATVYHELTQRRADHTAGSRKSSVELVTFGDPVYPRRLAAAQEDGLETPLPADDELRSVVERGIFDWKSLPNTRAEVEGIASLYPTGAVRTFLGPDALEERIKSLDRRTRILHLAAHAFTDGQFPSNSFVALSIPEAAFDEDTESVRDNGLLQVWEIFERVRLDADLVVLSACESGLGRELGSEGLIGLTRAFQFAGARSVAASLWRVADQTTAELMIRFYRHLRSGLSKDEALRAAQLEFLRAPINVKVGDGQVVQKDASAPYYWAAFQIYGDWQ